MRFRASKNARKINAKTRSTKASQKNLPESILASIFAPQEHPNSLPKALKSLRKAMLNEACVATLCKSPANRRKSSHLRASRLSLGSFKGLGLLDQPLVALILNFGSPKPSRIAPKSFKIAPQSDARRSLFRDAMQIAKKSSQTNGARRL